jgi:DNA-binding Xre family transcriptional regulator
MSKSDLRKKVEIAPNTMTKLRRDEEVSPTILGKICKILNVDFGILWSMYRMQKFGICITRIENFLGKIM